MPYWFDWVYFLVYLLAYSNSAINPIMYSGLNKTYEKELRKIVNIFVGKKNGEWSVFSERKKEKSKTTKIDLYG